MTRRRKRTKLEAVIPVNDYISIHPALDFYDGKAIVSVGCRWQEIYAVLDNKGKKIDTKVNFITTPYSVVSDGDKFRFSREELAKRELFYSGKIELSEEARWEFEDISNWSETRKAPTIAELWKEIRDLFEYYVDYSDSRYYDLLASFVIYTYFYPLFYNAPVVQFWGEMRTGKTKSLSLLDTMVFNPINSANISSASVFRLIESRRSTILFDESEDLMTSERARDIRNMLLAGTGKSGETFRQEKASDDSYKTQSFKVFSPKVIAHISGIDSAALLSRVIRVGTIASKDRVKQNRCVEPEDRKWQKIRNKLYRVCLTRFDEVIEARESLSDSELHGRTLYIWQGIITIASLTGNDKIVKGLVELAIQNKEEIEAEIEEFTDDPRELIERILETFKLDEPKYVTPDQLYNAVRHRANVSSKRDLGFKLGKLGIRSRTVTIDKYFGRHYHLDRKKLERMLKA